MSHATTAGTVTTIGTISIPAGTWLVLGFADLASSGSGIYVFGIGTRSTRLSEASGGGMVNFNVFTGTQTVNVIGYTTTANTMRVSYALIRLA